MPLDTESTVRRVLGEARVKAVKHHIKVNFDDLPILRVNVVYDSKKPPSVDEMTLVMGALIDAMVDADAPFPVIDFVADTEDGRVASE